MNEQAHETGSGWETAGVVGLHLVLGTVWFFLSTWMYLDRYLFCSDEPALLGPLLLVLAVSWLIGAFFVGWIRHRGGAAWPWSVAWFFVTLVVFAIAVYRSPEPASCGFF